MEPTSVLDNTAAMSNILLEEAATLTDQLVFTAINSARRIASIENVLKPTALSIVWMLSVKHQLKSKLLQEARLNIVDKDKIPSSQSEAEHTTVQMITLLSVELTKPVKIGVKRTASVLTVLVTTTPVTED